jgi:hypothetical protein
MQSKIFKTAVKPVSKEKSRGFRIRTGIRAGSTLQNIVGSIPASLRSYS